MRQHRFPLVTVSPLAAVIALLTAPIAVGDDGNPVGEALAKEGYTKTALYRDQHSLCYCDLSFDKKQYRFYLDTGSATTCISDKCSEELGVKVFKETRVIYGWGGGAGKTFDARTSSKTQMTPFHLPPRVDVSVGFGVEHLQHLGSEKAIGILGIDALNHFSAVFDTSRGVMYTIDPWVKQKGLAGEWKASSVMTNGSESKPEYIAGTSLRFEDGQAKLVLPNEKSEQTFDVAFVRTTGEVREFNWYSGERNTPWKLIYKLTGDELTVCCPYGLTDPKKMARPTAFTSTKENEYALFTFTRVKAEKK